MGADMSKEEQYKIATIVCASVAGALLIVLLLTWICCCVGYERRRRTGTTHVAKPRLRSSKEVVRWEANPYEVWGQPVQQGGCGCGSGGGASTSGGCRGCEAYSASAYDWMGGSQILNNSAYNAMPIKTSGEYGKVLLNPPSAVCNKPNIPSAQLAGRCNTGPSVTCGNSAAVNSSGYLTGGANAASTGAQFVLESAANRY